jgi:hypothetical protein
LSSRQIARRSEKLLNPVKVPEHRFRLVAGKAQPRESLHRPLDPILQLDLILSSAPVARLELEITRDHPMSTSLDTSELFQHLRDGRLLPSSFGK